MSDTLKPLIIAAALLVALCTGWYFFVYRPEAQKLQSVEGEVEDLILKLQSFSVSDKQIAALEIQIEKLKADLGTIEAKLITKQELGRSLQQFQKRGRSYGLKFDTLLPDFDSLMDDPEAETSEGEILKLKVQMKLKGRYINFGKFVTSFPTFPFYIEIDEMTLFFNQEIHPEVDIVLEASVYMRKNPVVQAKS